MKHKLPSLQEIVQYDFYYYEGELSEGVPAEALAGQMIFCRHEGQLYQLLAPYAWQPALSLPQPSSLQELIPLLANHPTLLIESEPGQPLGYVQAAHLLPLLYDSYRYLEAYFDTMIQTMDASISVVDEEGKTVVWTSGAERIFSIDRKDILERPISDFFPVEMLRCLNTLRTGESVYHLQHQPRPDMFVLINTKPVMLGERIVGAVMAETDITSQVRLNQELYRTTTKVHHLQQEIAKLTPATDPFHAIKGSSAQLQATIELIKKIGTTNATTLILGESGVGKEVFAKALHNVRERPSAPFIALNCGAIPAALFESELFGYERGAFSGADTRGKMGKIELARGGTLFLDEIGDMPLDMQVKLLRVLQDKTYFAVGGTKQVDADFRIIAATNRNLQEMVAAGTFREDLYYRLNVVTLQIPPLRERVEDLIELAHFFLYEFSLRYQRNIEVIPQDVMGEIMSYPWPGNIRELRNTMERLVVLASDGVIKREYLPFALEVIHRTPSETPTQDVQAKTLQEQLELHERNILHLTLEAVEGNKMAAAKRLGISRATLYNRLEKLGVKSPPESR